MEPGAGPFGRVTGPGGRARWPGADLPGRRIFIAAPLPGSAVDSVTQIVEEVRAAGVPGGGRDVRWVRLDGLHLTLRFLGPTLEPRVELARTAMKAAALNVSPFDLEVGGAGTFPPLGRPRALWLGVREGMDHLGKLAAAVDEALVEAGWPPEGRPFRAHLTLARADGVPAGQRIAGRLLELAGSARIPARIDRIVLFESITGGGPARYEPLEQVPLRTAKDPG
jgi:RNA 2',3'-cyclic 3'-phosphodiesterase